MSTNDLKKGIKCTLIQLAGDTKLGGNDLLESRKALQRCLHKMDLTEAN